MSFPTTAAPALSNWQAAFGTTPLIMGAGTVFDINEIDGFDLPDIRSGDSDRPLEHGQFPGLDLYGGRDITIVGDFVVSGTLSIPATLAGNSLSWGGGSSVSTPPGTAGGQIEQPLWIQLPNFPALAIMCRVRKRTTPIDLAYSVGAMAQMTVLFHATDPRLYAPPQTSSCSTGTALAGGVFPATFPYSFSHGSTAGSIIAQNSGNFDTRPILTLTGPLTNPTVLNVTTGWQLTVTNPNQTGFTIAAGDTVVIDTDTHAINYFVGGTGQGSAIRSWIVPGSIWPSARNLIPGLTPGSNTVQLTSTGVSDTGTLAVNWASAYIL